MAEKPIAEYVWPHRAVGGNEANQLNLIHGCCACCLVPWPCPTQAALDEAVLTAVGANLTKWRSDMAVYGWTTHIDGDERG